MIISFIIPVYNTAQYIERCVLSIVSQLGTDEDLYEIIIINDGSTDDSAIAIASLEKAYPTTIKSITQENRGLGAARNAGQAISRGKYLFFADSDDYINENSLRDLVQIAQTAKDEIIGFGVIEINGEQKQTYQKIKVPNNPISSCEYLLSLNIAGGVWRYIYLSEFLASHNLSMPEGIYHEDELFITEALLAATHVRIVDLFVYIYEHRQNSITQTKNVAVRKKKVADYLFILDEFFALRNTSLSDKQRLALDRKIKLFSHDLVIVLIKQKLPKETIYWATSELKKLNLYPLPKIEGSWKHNIFRKLTNFKFLIWLYSESSTIRKFLSDI